MLSEAEVPESLVPPNDETAEQASLGACLIGRDAAVKAVFSQVTPQSFYPRRHQLIAEAMARLVAAGTPVDSGTVASELYKQGVIEEIGGMRYLIQLEQALPTVANAEFYAKRVRETEARRQLMEHGMRLLQAARDVDDVQRLMNDHVAAVQSIRFAGNSGNASHISDLVARKLDDLRRPPEEASGHFTRLRTGLTGLDDVFRRMRPGYIVVISGRPGEGKTTLMELIARHAAETGPVAIWSGECPREVMIERFLAMESLVTANAIADGSPDALREEMSRLEGAACRLGRLPIWLMDEQMPPTLGNIEATALWVGEKEGRPLALLCLDRTELLEYLSRKASTTEQMLDLVRDLKRMAMRLGCVLLLICQPNENRSRENRDRPLMRDLQYGAALKQLAQGVIFLQREDYEAEEGTPKTGRSVAWVLKCNDGPLGPKTLYFRDQLPAFFNSEHEYLVLLQEGR